MLNKPRKSFMEPMKVCLPQMSYNCMPGCESILAVTASWLMYACEFCLCGIRSLKSHVWWFLGMKEFWTYYRDVKKGKKDQSLDLGSYVNLLF